MLGAVQKAVSVMRPGGRLFFRDYGRGDHAQLRFSEDGRHKLEDNFYVRAEGTRAYYFTVGEVQRLCECAGLRLVECSYIHRDQTNASEGKLWHRVWIHGIFEKPIQSLTADDAWSGSWRGHEGVLPADLDPTVAAALISFRREQ
jgi:hypothetical protein